MAESNFDILIIGAGPAGYVAAIRASQLGFKTAIVEREHLGGICLNWGCIPTKALLRSAEIYRYMQHAKDFGLAAEKIGFDPGAIVARSRAVAKRLSDGVGFLMKKHKIAVIDGAARITKPGEVRVEGKGAPHPPEELLGSGRSNWQRQCQEGSVVTLFEEAGCPLAVEIRNHHV